MKTIARYLCVLMAVLWSLPATANLYCTGKIDKMLVNKSGGVWLAGTWRTDGQYTMICDMDTTWKDVSPGDCERWYVLMHSAYHAESTITLYYAVTGHHGLHGFACQH